MKFMKKYFKSIRPYTILILAFITLFTTSCEKEKSSEPKSLPTITTYDVIDLTETTITCGGHITSDGGSPVIARGVYWNTVSGAISEKNKTVDGKDTGMFESIITGLIPNTTYYITSYAKTAKGIKYGNEVSVSLNIAPCSPEKNTLLINNNSNPTRYFNSSTARIDNQLERYLIEGLGNYHKIKVWFEKEPSTGKYRTYNSFPPIPNGYCFIESTLDGENLRTPDNEYIYVIKKGENRYILNFCETTIGIFKYNCNITVE